MARNLNDRLTLKGYSVFFDFESIRDGKFNTQIYEAIQQADDFIFVLSQSALEHCSHPGDWVRNELEYALKLDKHILLVCPEEHFSGFPEDRPASLQPITFLQIHFLSQRYYDQSIQEIVSSLSGRSMSRWRIACLAGLVFCLGACLWFFLSRRAGNGAVDASDKIKVQCFLTKYRDLAVFEGITYSDLEYDAFHYEDSLDGRKYVVSPQSFFYHLTPRSCISPLEEGMPATPPPVFSLRIINNGGKTLIVNSAVVEVRNVSPRPDSTVFILSRGREYAFFGLAEDTCRVDYRMVDGNTGRIFREGCDTLVRGGNSHVFKPGGELPRGGMIVGHVRLQGREIPFSIAAEAARLEPMDHEMDLPSVYVSGRKPEQTLAFSSFPDRNLVSGETDDRYRFMVEADRSCSFEMRAVLKTVDKKAYASDWISVSVFRNSGSD